MHPKSPTATEKGRIKPAKENRVAFPIRLSKEEHSELQEFAKSQERSMGFVARKYYLAGRDLAKNETD